MTTIDAVHAGIVTLADVARTEAAELAAELAGVVPGLVDEPAWMARARVLSGRLPLPLRQAVRDFRRDSGEDGVLLVRNLPVDQTTLPATPSGAQSVRRQATAPVAVLALLASQLGEPLAFREEKMGALVQDVVPIPGHEREQSNAGSTRLALHVENAFHPHRPDFVMLFCLRGDHDGQAGLQTSSLRQALPRLPARMRKVLAERRYVTAPPPSFGGNGMPVSAHAVLTGDPADPDVRIDFAATEALDAEAATAMRALGEAFTAVGRSLTLAPGDLAVVDNRLTVHGRTAFVPRYDGLDRWLLRAFVHLDFRRSRMARPGDGNVVSLLADGGESDDGA